MLSLRCRKWAVYLGLHILALSIPVQAQTEKQPPNIILIVADDLGWADLGCYGSRYHRTPNLDRLAKEGVRFTDAYAACTVCSPTRAALMTGKSPAQLHLTDFIPGRDIRPDQKLRRPNFQQHLPLEELTLAEKLKWKGYRTAAFGKWHLGAAGFEAKDQGFDVSTPDLAGFKRLAPFSSSTTGLDAIDHAKPGEELTSAITRVAVEFIQQNRSQPFFLYLPHVAVHIPLAGKADRVKSFERKKPGNDAGGQTNAIYAAMLESLDESVGTILKTLKDLRLDANTVILFTSDNGGLSVLEGPNTPATSNAPLRNGKGYLYEGGLRVPLIARWPGNFPAGRVSHQPVITMDLQATVIDLAGIKDPSPSEGRTFASLLKGETAPPDHPLFWHYPHYSNQGGKPGGAVREGNLKLIEHYESGYLELFDLEHDLSETHNLAGEMPERANLMAKHLADWRKTVRAEMPTRNTNYVAVPISARSDGTILLPAHEVTIHGKNVRYEPPAHKNTIGYWTLVDDWVSWDITIPSAGTYEVEILQGCGQGSGGSEVRLMIGDRSLEFTVQDTGHFQNFVRRQMGKVSLEAGRASVEVRPKKKPGVAVMDLREVLLKPVK